VDRNLNIRINDVQHTQEYSDRFNRCFTVHPGINKIIIPLDNVINAPLGRKMDMNHIQTICVFARNVTDEFVAWFDDFILESQVTVA